MKTAIAAAVLVALAGVASAAAPTKINLQGVLRADAGGLEDGNFTFRVQFFVDASTTTPFLDETYAATPVNSGVFSIDVGGMTTGLAGALGGASAPHVQISVNGNAMPKQQMGSVAYALHSETAVSATTVPFAGVSGFPALCTAGQKLLGYMGGAASCTTDADTGVNAVVPTGTGLSASITSRSLAITLDANFQRRTAANALSCGANNFLRSVAADGTPTCAVDATITTVSASGGLTGSVTGTTVTIGTDATVQRRTVAPTCNAGQVLSGIAADGTPTCLTIGTAAGNVAAGDHTHFYGCSKREAVGTLSATVQCQSGERLISGGCDSAGGSLIDDRFDCTPLTSCLTLINATSFPYNRKVCQVSSGDVTAEAICCESPIG